jgi:hypothetical protein
VSDSQVELLERSPAKEDETSRRILPLRVSSLDVELQVSAKKQLKLGDSMLRNGLARESMAPIPQRNSMVRKIGEDYVYVDGPNAAARHDGPIVLSGEPRVRQVEEGLVEGEAVTIGIDTWHRRLPSATPEMTNGPGRQGHGSSGCTP